MAIFLSLTCPPFPLLITSDLQVQAFFKLCQQTTALEDDQPQKVIMLMTRQMTQAIGGRTLWRSVKPIYGTTPTTMFSSR